MLEATSRSDIEQLDLFAATPDVDDSVYDEPKRSSQLTELPGTAWEHIFEGAA